MNREDRRYERAPPGARRHLAQDEKEQEGRANMEEDAGEMVAGRIHPIELGIEHV
jgi:hypothetical protein